MNVQLRKFKVFFHYNQKLFVKQTSSASTSNNDENIHNILFTMVRKTEAISLDMMELGGALAVIIFNEGCTGIQKIFSSLGLEISTNLKNAIYFLDKRRIRESFFPVRVSESIPHKNKRGLYILHGNILLRKLIRILKNQ